MSIKGNITTIICNKTAAIFDTSEHDILGPKKFIDILAYNLNAVYVPELNKYQVIQSSIMINTWIIFSGYLKNLFSSQVDCLQATKLPAVAFVFDGRKFVIHSKYYSREVNFILFAKLIMTKISQ